MKKYMELPADYAVLSDDEMTYTTGGRRGNPLPVMGRAMDAISDDMSKSPSNFLRDVVSTGTVVALAPLSALLLIL